MGEWDTLRLWDSQVLTALAAGDCPQAFDALVRGYQDVVVGYCRNMLGDGLQGQEVAQEVFLAVYRALPRFQQDASVRTWVFAIARKQCLKHMRKDRRRAQLRVDQRESIVQAVHPERPSSPEDSRLAREQEERDQRQLERLAQLLLRLQKRDKDLLMMRYFLDLSFADIAKKCWVSETTVRRRVHAAEQRLSALMAREMGTNDA